MTCLATLPLEIILNILSYLFIQEIHKFRLVSRECNHLFATNESSIYHEAAVLHRFTPSNAHLANARGHHSGPWLNDLGSWKDLCQRWFQLEKNWEGRGTPPMEGALEGTRRNVHRFKIDEERHFVITTHSSGGLTVSSMDENAIIFSLSSTYVRKYAHCEYGNGFVIFDRDNPHALEVWRLETPDWDGKIPAEPQNRYRPVDFQTRASREDIFRTLNHSRLGCFSPWALLIPPGEPRAFRFVYPTLLIGSAAGRAVYLFDIPSATLIQTISLAYHHFFQRTDDRFRIQYVELGARHVFICSMDGVLIVPRDQSHGPRFLEMPSPNMTYSIPELARSSAVQISRHLTSSHHAIKTMTLSPPRSGESTALVRMHGEPPIFTAIHVSPDGKDFAAINQQGILFLVRDFERVERGEASFSDITLRINFDSPLSSLAFEHGRVAVQTKRTGVFVVNWDTAYHRVTLARSAWPASDWRLALFPNLTIYQLAHFSFPRELENVSCLQMTKTAVWLNWCLMSLYNEESERALDDDTQGRGRRTVCYIDFSPRGT